MTRFHALQISSVNTGADEPLWVVNIKKSIASQLQLDVTGVRGDASAKDGESSTFSTAQSGTRLPPMSTLAISTRQIAAISLR